MRKRNVIFEKNRINNNSLILCENKLKLSQILSKKELFFTVLITFATH